MSPVDPISPTSSMDVSPVTPTAMVEREQFDMPVTPLISPSMHLPKLVTSFQNSSATDALRRMSVQFQLLTPSPLSLQETPLTAVQRQRSVPWHKRNGAMVSGYPAAERDTPASPMSGLAHEDPRSPRDTNLPPISPSAHRKIPSLKRQNANDGLEAMQSPIIEHVVRLPLRLSTRPSATALQNSADIQALPTNQLSTQFQSTTYRHILPKPSAEVGSNDSPTTARVRPRSPIHKRCHHQRHLSPSQPTKIVFRRPQTPQQKQLHASIAHLGSELIPLISVRTGRAHPEFPKSLLQYHLLTHDQLDSLARWYHQTVDAGQQRWMYPCPIAWGRVWCGFSSSTTTTAETPNRRHLVDLDTKRRRWGRFIGLRGCDSPVDEQQENITERMERDWREALRKAEEDRRVQEKLWGRRF